MNFLEENLKYYFFTILKIEGFYRRNHSPKWRFHFSP